MAPMIPSVLALWPLPASVPPIGRAVLIVAIGAAVLLALAYLVSRMARDQQSEPGRKAWTRALLTAGGAVLTMLALNELEVNWLGALQNDSIAKGLRIALMLALGLPALRLLARLVGRLLKPRLSEQSLMLVVKGVFYAGAAILVVMSLNELGFKLGALLGTAGVVGVAVGFASQTSLSNMISGLFLVSEKPFAIGDIIEVGGTTGVVASIDLLSVKLRTFDNKLVRIPNESLIKTAVTNVTHFPIRRFDLNLGVSYKENIARVIEVLRDVADKNAYCLDEPEPVVFISKFGDSAIELLLGVWHAREDMLNLRRTLLLEIKQRFDAEGIEVPFPQRSLVAGSTTAPFPVQIVGESGGAKPLDG